MLISLSILLQWAANTRPADWAARLARLLRCPAHEPAAMVRCLKYSRTAAQLVTAQNTLRLDNFARMQTLGSESAPCADSTFRPPSSGADIGNPVPTLVTSVRDEGTVFAALAVKNFYRSRHVSNVTRPWLF